MVGWLVGFKAYQFFLGYFILESVFFSLYKGLKLFQVYIYQTSLWQGGCDSKNQF